MMKKTVRYFTLLLGLSLASCGGGNNPEAKEDKYKTAEQSEESEGEAVNEATDAEETSKEMTGKSEAEYRAFLISPEGTYGWRSPSDDKSLDFFKDGRLFIQGPDGEAPTWESSWALEGEQLTIKFADIELEQTYTVRIKGENLKLDELVYSRN
ncbi:MAG: hypothetical protein HC913_03800 [Microscillaceae bacterium]|nr:hypothetical protein [Microscillaceae bacterium]